MMRARHMHIPISPERAEEWLDCMKQALEETGSLSRSGPLY